MLWARAALAIPALFALSSCDRAPSPRGDSVAPAASLSPSAAPLGLRAEEVARADALAVEAKVGGARGAAALENAGRIRARLFRREHKQADALEAVELTRQWASAQPAARCRAELSRALLEGELTSDADATYRALYALSRGADASCRESVTVALEMLEAFRSNPEALAALAPSAAASAAGAVPPSASPSASPGASGMVPSGVVPSAKLLHVDRYSAKDAARVVVFVSDPVKFQVGMLEGDAGSRLFVDLPGVRYSGVGQLGAEGLLTRVRLAENPQGTRVVLDLAGPVEHRAFYVPEPFRLVIDVAKPQSGAITRDVRRVVLDPGHGGHDPGAIGPTGLREKDVALDIAHRAAPLIARELGISTLLTRDTDVFVPLEERTARANGFGADLFVSIHCNATERSGGSGVMTFVLDDSKDQLATRIAAVENSSSAEGASELARAMSATRQSSDRVSDARSGEFAGLLQRAAMASLAPSYPDVPDGGVKRAGFYVLAGARMPAVLFETSFISSARDETRFNTGDFRQKLADAIVNAIRAYKEGRR
jgi:N-acetylmuramoyl-L-alanine amidase